MNMKAAFAFVAVIAWALNATSAALPENDSFAARIALFGANVATTGDNIGATREIGEPDPNFAGGRSVWWTWTAPANGNLTATTAGSDFDTMLTLFTGDSVSNLTLVAFNDTESTNSIVTLNVIAGTTYQIAVDGVDGTNSMGNISLQLTLGPTVSPPSNDNFANRITLTGAHLNNVAGSNVAATAEPGEPLHADALGLKSVWWTWTAPSSGGLTLTSSGTSIRGGPLDTVLAIYTGDSVSALTSVAGNDEDDFGYESTVTCNVTSNVTYQIAVDGFEGDEGQIRLRLDLAAAFPVPVNDDFVNRKALSGSGFATNGSNVGATFEAGEPTHLLIFGGKSVWYRWTAPMAGSVSLTVSNDLLDTVVTVYRGTSLDTLTFVAGNDENPLTAIDGDSAVYFNVVSNVTYQIAVDGVDGDTGNFRLRLTMDVADPVPENNNFINRITITGTNTTVTGSNVGATIEPNEPLHRGYYGGNSVWWRWTSPAAGFVTFDTIGSPFDTILAVYTNNAIADLVEIASDDNSGGTDNYNSLITFPTRSDVTYQIAVDGYDGDAWDIQLRVRFTPATYSLIVTTNPPDAGSVDITPLPDQAGKYVPGELVTLTATPTLAPFAGWSGSISSTNNPLIMVMRSDMTVQANFQHVSGVRYWTGSHPQNGNWTAANNWDEGRPKAGDKLIFPAGALRLTGNTNDFPEGTVFDSIIFNGDGYVLRGNGVGLGSGILSTNTTGLNTVSLTIQLSSNQVFQCTDPAAQLVVNGDVALANRTLMVKATGGVTLSGAISGTGGIIKTNAGTLSLAGSNPNTFSGQTLVSEGTLQLGKSGIAVPGALIVGDGVGGAGADVVRFMADSQLANSSAVTINNSGELDLNGFSGGVGSLAITGGNVATGAGILGLNGNATVNASSLQANITGNLSLQGGTRTFNVANGSAPVDLLVSAIISNGGVTKTGSGRLQLTGPNTYAGTTTVDDGTLALFNSSALGTADQGTVVNIGATLSLAGVAVNGEPLTVARGTVESAAGSNSWAGNIELDNNGVFSTPQDTTLNLSGVISGTGSLTKDADGTLILSGSSANIYSGVTTVNRGTLLLGKITGNAIPGPLVIGDGSGAGDDLVRFIGDSQLGSSSAVTVNSSGRLDLDAFTGSIGSLTMTGGNVDTGSGTLGLNGDAAVNASTAQANISGRLSLQGATRLFNVADGSAAIDLLLSAIISDGGIIKAGSGRLHLTGANTYAGNTAVDEGTLAIFNSSALGTADQGTVVNTGALLSVNAVAVNGEPLTLANSTVESAAGSNSWAGNIQLNDNGVFTTTENTTLNLSGVISGTGSLTKNTDGTLILSGASPNTYSGTTTVNDGTLLLTKTTSNAIPGTLVIGAGPGASLDVVKVDSSQQISMNSEVIVNAPGVLELNASDSIAALSGGGPIVLANSAATLSVGHGNTSTTFTGLISGAGGLAKAGTGTLTLTADNTYSGQTLVSDGSLVVNGSQPSSSVLLNSPGLLGGTGRVGNLSGSGSVSPGSSSGVFLTGDLDFVSNTTYRVELNGPDPGIGHDQLSVVGSVHLAGLLNATLGFTPATNASFTILENDGSDPITGTFNGLPENAFLVIGETLFQISYAAGPDSNDVVLTRAVLPPSTISSLSFNGNGQAHIQGIGVSGLSYVLEFTPVLNEPITWTPLSTNSADTTGAYEFSDGDSPFFPMRFYRVRTLP
jgi:autotransporter-associated beta strand protein